MRPEIWVFRINHHDLASNPGSYEYIEHVKAFLIVSLTLLLLFILHFFAL